MSETTVVTALTSAITSIASQASDALVAIIPVAAPVMGALIVISIAIKTVQKFTGRK